MKHFSLPGNDTIPALGLGTWKSGKGEVYHAVKEALSIGYRHIDCAPAYENETEVGAAIGDAVREGTATRDELWVTSKLWNNAHEAECVQPALEKTLRDLSLEYLDLFLIHWPVVFINGVFFPRRGEDFVSLETVPISETWQALEECVKKGLVKHIGVSNFSVKKLQGLKEVATIQPAMNQIELHPLLQQPKMVEYCGGNNILLTAYSPLGSGDRPAGLKKDNEPSLLAHPVIKEIADKHGATTGQVLISWAMMRDTVVIPKSVNPGRLKENFVSAELVLDDEDMEAVKAMDQHYRFVDGSFWQAPGSPYTIANIWDGEE